jgi:hypothetical protein
LDKARITSDPGHINVLERTHDDAVANAVFDAGFILSGHVDT